MPEENTVETEGNEYLLPYERVLFFHLNIRIRTVSLTSLKYKYAQVTIGKTIYM